MTWWVGVRGGAGIVWVGGEGGGAGWLAGADEENSHTLVLYVFVLTVSGAQSPPQECTGSPDHTMWRSQTEPQHREDVLLFPKQEK